MNEVGIKLLGALGWSFIRTEKRGTQYVAIATKPRPDGGEWKSEAGGTTIPDAERRLVQVVTRR